MKAGPAAKASWLGWLAGSRHVLSRLSSHLLMPTHPNVPMQKRCVVMASYNGERCIRLWELPSFEARGTLRDINNARALAGSVAGQLVFSGDEHGRVKVWRWKLF